MILRVSFNQNDSMILRKESAPLSRAPLGQEPKEGVEIAEERNPSSKGAPS